VSVLKAFLLLLVVAALSLAGVFIWAGSRGLSARAQPGPVETTVARAMRRLAIPRADRDRRSPMPSSPETVADGLEHYADHCAVCHAADGSGQTEMGLGLYPKPPDMRLAATQALTDGELFSIIENGVRLTGMPAWSTGTSEGETSTWHLVHFIRELPRLTEDQLERVKQLTPRSPADVRREIEEERFLQGGEVTPPGAAAHDHTGERK
jgi:mono/diheme cytochrome c family protein